MNLAELQKTLREVDEAAVLVSPRILERVVRDACALPSFSWNVPHWKTFVANRQQLFRHAEQADLELQPDQLLPETVILLARPSNDELSWTDRSRDAGEKPRLLLKYWRRLFHARVHLALMERQQAGLLTAEGVAARAEELGRTLFEEVRAVLVKDEYLP